MNTKIAVSIAAGIAASAFIGYCIYFDKKRRNDPEYKRKVHERRRRQREAEMAASAKKRVPDINDFEAVQRYFINEIHQGEVLIAQGELETGVEHLANALMVCGQIAGTLNLLKNTLPSNVYTMLVSKLREMGAVNINLQQSNQTPVPRQAALSNDGPG